MQLVSILAVLLVCSTAKARQYFFRGKVAKAIRQEGAPRESQTSSSSFQENEVSSPSSSAFGTSMFSELCAEHPSENVLFSPLSVYQALALVREGATIGSENEAELKQLLGPQIVQDQASELQKQTENNDPDADVHLSMATSIWADNLTQSYIDDAKQSQSADALPLPETYAEVDDWIENKTSGMITELMGDEPLDPLTRALLVNTVHFKGTWTYEFDASETVNGTFVLHNLSEVDARYMTDQREMQVIRGSSILSGASAVMLDYGQHAPGTDPEFSSIFILPALSDDISMSSVIEGLNSGPISELLTEFGTQQVRLKLPRFRLEFGPAQLKDALMNMGMEIAFNESIPDKFLQMSDDRWLYVDNVHHGACMEVTEEGTEAAAATVVVIRTRSAPRIFQLAFNRPFVVIILHRPTTIPVFIGKVENPAFFF